MALKANDTTRGTTQLPQIRHTKYKINRKGLIISSTLIIKPFYLI